MSRAPCAALIAVVALTTLNLSACNSREDPDPRTPLRLVEVAEVRAAGHAEHHLYGCGGRQSSERPRLSRPWEDHREAGRHRSTRAAWPAPHAHGCHGLHPRDHGADR